MSALGIKQTKLMLRSPAPGVRVESSLGIEPLAAFRAARSRFPDALFFERSNAAEAATEASIVAIGPFERVRHFGGAGDQSVFARLKDLMAGIACENSAHAFANGGVFGCVGYDCVREVEPRLRRSGNLARNSASPSAELIVARRLLAFDAAAGTVALIDARGDGVGDLEQILFDARAAKATRISAVGSVEAEAEEPEASRFRPSLGASGFATRVAEIKERIRDGDIFQAVLAERFEIQLRASAAETFDALADAGPAPYRFCLNFGDRTFFGASPETLVRAEAGMLRSRPIAGTRLRGHGAAADARARRNLERSSKEAAEHLMLVDLARNDLGRVAAPGTVHVSRFRDVQTLPHLFHLVSDVEARLAKGRTALDALISCFPAGTLSGAPKIRAMEILSDLEPEPRGLYGGAIVAFDGHGGLDSCIAIRAIEARADGVAILRAGAGVVADLARRARIRRSQKQAARLASRDRARRSAKGGPVTLLIDHYDSFNLQRRSGDRSDRRNLRRRPL